MTKQKKRHKKGNKRPYIYKYYLDYQSQCGTILIVNKNSKKWLFI